MAGIHDENDNDDEELAKALELSLLEQ